MTANQIEFVRIVGNERRAGATLQSVSRHWQSGKECFLFISPHDDDAVLGGGLFMQLAQLEKTPVHILIVTDGAMGYCSKEEKSIISDIRRKETFACYQSLGIPKENITWLGFPDCQLNSYTGRRPAEANDKTQIEGFTGLQNAFTHHLRRIRPSQCFLPTSGDLHPDHVIVHSELLISLFHATGSIWPELGTPLEKPPYVHEFGVYCDFPEPPSFRIRTPQEYLDKKLNAITAFKSQRQISSLIDIVRRSGSEEYLRELHFKLYQPTAYRDRFEKKDSIPYLR